MPLFYRYRFAPYQEYRGEKVPPEWLELEWGLGWYTLVQKARR